MMQPHKTTLCYSHAEPLQPNEPAQLSRYPTAIGRYSPHRMLQLQPTLAVVIMNRYSPHRMLQLQPTLAVVIMSRYSPHRMLQLQPTLAVVIISRYSPHEMLQLQPAAFFVASTSMACTSANTPGLDSVTTTSAMLGRCFGSAAQHSAIT